MAEDDPYEEEELEEGYRRRRAASKSRTPVLDNFIRDVSRLAEEGKLDPVIGREEEVQQIAQILARRRKSNILLLGQPGVGKTSLVNGLALRILQNKTTRILLNHRVVELDIGQLFSGTKYRGQFEERLQAIINELENSPHIILFIEDVMNIFKVGGGQGTESGQFSAYSMLKSLMQEGRVKCICCSTPQNFESLLEKDSSLKRIFEVIHVNQPNVEATIVILQNIAPQFEDFHFVSYSDESLKLCVELSYLYMPDRSLPDKAVDLMDEVGANIRMKNIHVPKHIIDLEKRIDEVKERKNIAVKNQQYELGADLRDQESKLFRQLEFAKVEWEEESRTKRYPVGERDVINFFHYKTGIPIETLENYDLYDESILEEKNAEYYKKKLEEYELDGKMSTMIYDIPDILKTSLQQYILYFRDFVEKVKGKKIFFDVSVVEEGLRLDFQPNEIDDFEQIESWFGEYFDYVQQKEEDFSVHFETKEEPNELESQYIMSELKNQIRFLNMQLETIQLKVKDLSLENESMKNVFLRVDREQKKYLASGYADEDQYKTKLRERIANGEVKQVLADLVKYIKEFREGNEDKRNEVVLFSSRLNDLEFQTRSEIITEEKGSADKRKLILSILKFIDEL